MGAVARCSRGYPVFSGQLEIPARYQMPDRVEVTSDIDAVSRCEILLLTVPMQQMRGFLVQNRSKLQYSMLVACSKGIEVETGLGPLGVIQDVLGDVPAALLTGPSFAHDIAVGLPTALTLACTDPVKGGDLQEILSRPALRIYRTTDVIGASLGGALKNVMAIACGVCDGVDLGDSARAALLTRGFAEMQRIALHQGADPETLQGLSGLGDLVLTCTSTQSRNFRYGVSLGAGTAFDPATTVEGAATARAMYQQSQSLGLETPITDTVVQLMDGAVDIQAAMSALLSRPLKEE